MLKKIPSFSLLLVALCIGIALFGCRKGVPVMDQASSMPLMAQQAADKDIENAIIRAGLRTGWDIVPAGNKTLIGTLNIRAHQAVVLISYDSKRFSIRYEKSTNLDYKNGKIHPNYNKWVATLDNNIRHEFSLLGR